MNGDDADLRNEKANRTWIRRGRVDIAFSTAAVSPQLLSLWWPRAPAALLSGLLLCLGVAIWLTGHTHLQVKSKKVIASLVWLSVGSGFLAVGSVEGYAEWRARNQEKPSGVQKSPPSALATSQPTLTSAGAPGAEGDERVSDQNLIEQKSHAKWMTSDGRRIRLMPPNNTYDAGYAMSTDADMEDGSSGKGGVLVWTPWREGAWTSGEFSLTTPIRATDRLVAIVGFHAGAEVYEAKFAVECDGGTLAKPVRAGEVVNRLDNELETLDQPLRKCEGARTLRLYTVAGEQKGTCLIWTKVQIQPTPNIPEE